MKKYHTYLSILILSHFLLFFFTGLFRHWGFLTSINDLAHFDQAIWGTIKGQFLLNTDFFNMPTSRLAMHFDPIQLIFVPFYLIYPSVVWLTAGQSIALAIAALPIYSLASRVLNSEKLGLMWAVAYLVNPFVVNAAVWDFHPITIAVPFVALGILAVEVNNFKVMMAVSVILLFCKEHLGVMVIGFGVLWAIKNKQLKQSFVLVVLGFFHFVVVLKFIIPHFSPTGEHSMIAGSEGLNRYSWLGKTMSGVIKNLLSNPIEITWHVISKSGGGFYLFLLSFPFIFLSFFGVVYLLLGLADLAANMLSGVSLQRHPISYHSATLIPIFTVAAVYGLKYIKKLGVRMPIQIVTSIILACSMMFGYLVAPLPLPGSLNFWAAKSFFNLPDPKIKEIRGIIGENASISVQSNLGPHFSQREKIYRYPSKIGDVDAIILRINDPTLKIENFRIVGKYNIYGNENKELTLNSFENHLQMGEKEYLISIEKLLKDKEYGVLYWKNPWLVFRKNVDDKFDINEIRKVINERKKEWH